MRCAPPPAVEARRPAPVPRRDSRYEPGLGLVLARRRSSISDSTGPASNR
jgi:hypothetical protein